MFNDLTVKIKLWLLVGFCVAALAVVGLVGNSGIQGCAGSLNEVGKVRLPSILGLEILNEAQTAIRLRTIETAIWENDYSAQNNFAEVITKKKAAWERAEKGWKIYEPLPQTPEEAKIWERFVKEWGDWKAADAKITETMVALSKNKQEAEQKHLFKVFYDQYEAARPMYRLAEASLGKIVELNVKIAEEEGKTSDQTISFSKKSMLAVGVIAILVATFLGMIILRSVTRPLSLMRDVISEVERTGDYSKKVDYQSKDEVGQTSSAFNGMMGALQEALSNTNAVMEAVAKGDFNTRVKVDARGDLNRLKESVNTTVDKLELTMKALNETMLALYNGDFSKQVDAKAEGEFKHAINQASQSMRAMQSMLGDVGSVMAGVAQGDLTQRVKAEGRGDLAKLKENINQSLGTLGDAMRAVSGNTRQVAAAANQSSTAIGQISDGAQNQMHAINQVASAVRQTAASVTDVSRSTETASEKSRESVTIVRSGKDKMARMVEVVNNIAINSEKINKITDVIEKIANKTNLLSLNAAIEAARAGEHGRGFAVVAEEVGKLAANSAESTQEIAQLVQQAVNEANRAVATVKEVSGDMNRIEEGSMQSDAMLARISAALEQQSAAVQEINANVASLNKIAEKNAAASEEITATVVELSKIADNTRREVEKFRV